MGNWSSFLLLSLVVLSLFSYAPYSLDIECPSAPHVEGSSVTDDMKTVKKLAGGGRGGGSSRGGSFGGGNGVGDESGSSDGHGSSSGGKMIPVVGAGAAGGSGNHRNHSGASMAISFRFSNIAASCSLAIVVLGCL